MTSISSKVYPPQLAPAVDKAWRQNGEGRSTLPELPCLVHFFEVLFHVSFLLEEGESIRCRAIFATPDEWHLSDGPPSGFLVLPFQEPRPFTPQEIRKLASAASYHRSLLGVTLTEACGYNIWGLIQSGARWVNRVAGGRFHGIPLPPHLVCHISGPGHLLVSCGYERLIELKGGKILENGFDPFRSKWLHAYFQPVRAWLLQQLEDEHLDGALVQEDFVKHLAQNVLRRTFSIVRNRGHGGMLLYLPMHIHNSPEQGRMLRIRCPFASTPATRHLNRLVLQAMKSLALLGREQKLAEVSWHHYQFLQDPLLSELDESLFEMANLLADLMSVDGALVLNQRFHLVGFGAEVLGEVPVQTVYQALDLEATETEPEPAENSGTRHRAAYRLVQALPEVLVVVISQDETIRFVANHEGNVTYFPFLP